MKKPNPLKRVRLHQSRKSNRIGSKAGVRSPISWVSQSRHAALGQIRNAGDQGRFMYGLPEELSRWLGREAGLDVPVRIASENMDLSADLKRALFLCAGWQQGEKSRD
jgi:hypothetical protein